MAKEKAKGKTKEKEKEQEGGKLKFPYTMHCPGCKAGLKIANPKLVGTYIPCPKCKKRIEVVTPDEDGSVPYVVEDTSAEDAEKNKKKKPTKAEIEAKEAERSKAKREKIMANTKHVLSIVFLLVLLGGACGVFYYLLFMRPKESDADTKKKKVEIRLPADPTQLAYYLPGRGTTAT